MKDLQDEQFIVVNKKDEVIGHKSRFECHHDKSLIHRAVDVILFNSDNKIALQKRSMLKDLYPGYYCTTAGGHVTQGDSWEEAAYRELKEEMGIENIHLEKKDTYIVYSDQETEMITMFIGVYDGKFIFPKDEVESIHYFSRNEIKNATPITKSTIECLKKLKWL